MSNTPSKEITSLARAFLEPQNATHRQYEALRAYFFGYTPDSFRVREQVIALRKQKSVPLRYQRTASRAG